MLMIEPAKSKFEAEAFRMPDLLDIGDSESEDEIVVVGPATMRRKSPGVEEEILRSVQRTGSQNPKTIHAGGDPERRNSVRFFSSACDLMHITSTPHPPVDITISQEQL